MPAAASETEVPFSSPTFSVQKFTNSQHPHLDHKLSVESLDQFPFPESFPGLPDDDIATSLLFPDPPENQRKADISADLSYDVEIKDIAHADLAPRFRDGEIEEAMVISPTSRPTCSFDQDVKANDFRLLHMLFKDSISSTYLCRKCDDLKLYAMQISNKERLRICTPDEYIQHQREVFHEIRELQSSFLSPFIWSYEDGPEIRSITAFYPHGNLQDLLDRDTNLGENHTLQLASEMVEALCMLHTVGIIHRNLAPCNIMFDVSGHIVITGFGQACRPHSAASFPLHGIGPYCAPELILGWAHDFSVDCWSFGVMMYLMLFGLHPFAAKDENDNVAATQANIIHGSLIIPRTKSISCAAHDLLSKCLERNAALRLDIEQIRVHVYFCTVNWENVTDRITKTPVVCNNQDPVMDTQHSQLTSCMTVSKAQRAILTEDEPVTLTEEKHVDTFAPVPQRIVKFTSGSLIMHQDSSFQTQRRISSQGTRLDIIPEVSSDEEESLDERDVECSTQDRLRHLKQPPGVIDPKGNPGSLSFWDALDLEIGSIPSGYPQVSTAGREEPRGLVGMLRKSRSVIFQDRALSISITSTVPSELRIRNKLHKRMRPASTPTLRSPHLDRPLSELPTGVKQIGIDIDFNPMEPVASHSISVYRSAIRACKKLVPVIGRKISRQSLRTQEQLTSASVDSDRAQDAMVVMREIYGPTWTLGIESVPDPAGTLSPSATTNDSEGPVTPETPIFDHTVGIMQHKESSTLRLVPLSGLQPLV